MEIETKSSLTERVLEFQRTGVDGDAIVRDVARRVYEYPRRKCRWDEDSSSEFFVRVFPKIQRMIRRFRYVGRPFESYLSSTLMFQIRTFAQERRRRDLEWEVCTTPALWPPETGPEADVRAGPERGSWVALDRPLAEALGIGPDGRIGSATSRRRFLILCLKSAHLLQDADLGPISRIVDTPIERIRVLVETLREGQQRRAGRVELFTGRRNRAFCGLRMIEARLGREVDPERRAELERRYARLGCTVRVCQNAIARVRTAPSHREIAAALGMPKPTVDSAIHRLKQRAAQLYARRHAEYA